MFEKEVLNNTRRRKIYNAVTKQPGLHLRELERRLNIPLSTLNYHLDYLVRFNLLERRSDGHYTRFYSKGIDESEKDLLKVLRQKTSRKILLKLMLEGKMSYQEMHSYFKMPSSTLSFYLSKLVEAKAVSVIRIGRENYYMIKNENRIARLLIIYKTSFIDILVDKMMSTWMESKFSLKK